MRHRAARLALATALLAATVSAGVPLPTPAANAGAEAVPDLAMAPLDDFTIQWVNGRKLLRFTAMMVNVGAGHFEVCGHRPNTSSQMRVAQILYPSAARPQGGPGCPPGSARSRTIETNAAAKWAGDGHNHWHVQEMMRYDFWGRAGTLRGAKVGYCFLDSDVYTTALPGFGDSYYRGSWCQSTPSALTYRMGISIGWGDKYDWFLAWQWVDITGVPNGDYTVRAKVDPNGHFFEEDEANQCAYARLTVSGNSVTVNGRGFLCLTDWESTAFAADVQWAYDAGVTQGCGADLFCTFNDVTREQMASFLARALALPGPVQDHFTDDESSRHEADINRIADAAITTGCAPGRYCPRSLVSRE